MIKESFRTALRKSNETSKILDEFFPTENEKSSEVKLEILKLRRFLGSLFIAFTNNWVLVTKFIEIIVEKFPNWTIGVIILIGMQLSALFKKKFVLHFKQTPFEAQNSQYGTHSTQFKPSFSSVGWSQLIQLLSL